MRQQELSDKLKAHPITISTGIEGARLPKMTVSDDVEAFLDGFERAAITAGWDRKEWAIILGPLLTGPGQTTYGALSKEEARHYERVKETILY